MSNVKALTAGTISYIPITRIIKKEDALTYRNPDKAHVKSLAEDIKVRGLLQPLVVWHGTDTDKGALVEAASGADGETKKIPAAFLAAGQHRWLAIKMIRSEDKDAYVKMFPEGVPCTVIAGSVEDVILAGLRENAQRKDADAGDVFPALKKLRDDHGLKNKEIASRLGKSPSWVSTMFSVEETLGEEGQEAIKEGKVTVAAATKAASVVKKAKKAGKSVSVKEVLNKAKESKGDKERATKRLGAQKLYARYSKLPSMKVGAKLAVAEGILSYLAAETDEIPAEVKTEPVKLEDGDEG